MRLYDYMNTKLLPLLLILAVPLACLGQTATAPQPAAQTPTPLPPAAAPAKPAAVETSTSAGDQVVETLSFDDLPLPDAVQQLAKVAGLNVQIDPGLLHQKAADGTPIPPPSVKEKWKQVTPMQAMQALLFNYGWQTQRFANNPIVLIRAIDRDASGPLSTKVNLSQNAQIAGAAGVTPGHPAAGDEVNDSIAFDNIPLPDAIRNLAALAAMNIQLEPRLAFPQNANHHPIPSPKVNEKMKEVTARQAMQRLLDEFGWQATQITGNPILRIEAKAPKAPDATATPPQPR
jgi:hypothetical protein